MIVVFEKQYLKELYEGGKTSDKKHRFQPPIFREHIEEGKLVATICEITELSNHYK